MSKMALAIWGEAHMMTLGIMDTAASDSVSDIDGMRSNFGPPL